MRLLQNEEFGGIRQRSMLQKELRIAMTQMS